MTHQTLCLAQPGRVFAKGPTPGNDADQKTWYSINAEAAGDGESSSPIEIEIYDEIGGGGIRAVDFLRDLKAVDDGKRQITVGINSLGGDVFDGIAIHNALRRLGDRATARIDSVAASIASVIAVGAHKVVMPDNAMMMIHNPWTITWGEADDLRQTADMMDKVRDTLVASYRAKAPDLDEAELVQMLNDTTWLTAQEAVALGFADVIATTVPLKASAAMRACLPRLKNVPSNLVDAINAEEPPGGETPTEESETSSAETGTEVTETAASDSSPDPALAVAKAAAKAAARITQACLKAGIPEIAEVLIMNTPLTDEAAVTAEIARVQAIRDLCLTARLPELASDYVKSGMSADSARARLFDKLVQAGGKEIDNKEPPAKDAPKAKAKTPNSTEIYASRKAKSSGKASSPKPSKGAEQ